MKKVFFVSVFFLSVTVLFAEMQAPIPLWPDGAPGALGTSSNDIPAITPYLSDPTHKTGAAIVICPGGAYVKLAPHEGNDYALWLNHHGVTCFVLKYRLGVDGYRHPAMLEDGMRAIRWVRAHAAEYKIDPHRVGLMGSSAGGHLTSAVITHFDSGNTNAVDPVEQESSRPDIGILCYPVITMTEPFAHKTSKANLVGTNASPELIEETSSELQVKTNTPPCFIWQTFEDKTVPVENSLMFAEALRKAHVPFDLHIYQQGKHGQGLGDKPPFQSPLPWARDCLVWLRIQGFVEE